MKLAYVTTIKSIQPIKDADRIELVFVGNWQCVVAKNQFKVGEKVIYISIDTILPDDPWAAFYKAKHSRVRSIKLKKTWSQGIIESFSNVGITEDLPDGEDITDRLKIVKYEAAIPQNLDAKGNLPFGLFKTDEENVNSLDIIPFNEIVTCTLKRDGSSFSAYCKNLNKEWIVGITSRSMDLKLDSINPWTEINKKYNILEKLKDYCIKNNISLCLRGELTGNGLNGSKPNYFSRLPLDIGFFNILNLSDLQYLSFSECEKICKEIDLPLIEILERDVILTQDLIDKYKNLEKLNNNYIEGCVVKRQNGQSFKIINLLYDSLK